MQCQAILAGRGAIEKGVCYDLQLDYTLAPFPPFAEPDAAWLDKWLKQKGLRQNNNQR
ncbi:MAG: hypothetical protein HC769_06670 [Cyanobacteria bacterium CRU_2_1]|nr:hypothetical protein [Cyanobacteria bacterium RU_5_0]NJR58564.1 hypothetical protein [Cyanobacteria bacterium CRU_2_1]